MSVHTQRNTNRKPTMFIQANSRQQGVNADAMDATSFAKFFEWVSATFSKDSQSRGATDSVELPPPPPELNVVL